MQGGLCFLHAVVCFFDWIEYFLLSVYILTHIMCHAVSYIMHSDHERASTRRRAASDEGKIVTATAAKVGVGLFELDNSLVVHVVSEEAVRCGEDWI